jgi:hypothetical protein
MIGSRGFRIVEAPRASSGSLRVRPPLQGENHSSPGSEDRRSPCITLPQRERAPPELTGVAGKPSADPAPDMALGQRRAPLAQAKPISTRIDYGTESVVTSHTTSARAQCKSLVGRSSCGIVAAGRATSAIRASEAVP